jgi:general secretion pathway protein M
MQKLKDWLFSLQPRERALVLGGAAVVLLFAIYFLALAPFYSAVNSRAERVAKKQGDLAWMRSVGGEVMALSASSPTAAAPSNESLVVLIDRTARQAGLGSALRDQSPNGAHSLRLRLESASFDSLVAWLALLQQQHGVAVETANVDVGSAPGLVNASVTVGQAGAG